MLDKQNERALVHLNSLIVSTLYKTNDKTLHVAHD